MAVAKAAESATALDQLCINTIRTLSMDAVQQANSGHPGTAMAMAPVIYTLWQRFLRFDPEDPIWPNRDRFVLSIGHASMLLYSMLHLTGVKAVNPQYERLGSPSVPLDDIRRFRQLDSKCPGHPEYRWTSGVETTTGPLGSGVATSVGMAMAARWMGTHFNRPGFPMIDHDVYALCGDGDMMEGVSSEAASLAGHLRLANLCWVYDNNRITIEGHTEWAFTEDVATRFIGYGWTVTDDVPAHFAAHLGRRGGEARQSWMALFEKYREAHPVLADHLYRMQHRELPTGWDRDLAPFPADPKGVAGRDASSKVLNALAQQVPWLIGGSADLAPSTKTRLTFEGAGDFTTAQAGRNLHFGVREHAMGAILNGLSLSKVRPYGSGFLIFSDYMRPQIRLSALMELPVIYVFTHDSIGVGEDGPTHQPVEQLASLRAIPGLITLRPGDANEVVEAWRLIAGLRHEPVCLILSRQAMPTLDRTRYGDPAGLRRGAYVLAEAAGGSPEVLLLGSGSEVGLCVAAHERLTADGVRSRVVSMPSWELFEHQDQAYRDAVLPPKVTARVAVEQASTFGWARYAPRAIGMDTFGASAPLKELQGKFGFTVDAVVSAARQTIAGTA